MMRPLPLIVLLITCAACTDIPELEGSEAASLRTAPYPRLVPLDETLGPPVDPLTEAKSVEEDLIARGEALTKKAEALQNAQTN